AVVLRYGPERINRRAGRSLEARRRLADRFQPSLAVGGGELCFTQPAEGGGMGDARRRGCRLNGGFGEQSGQEARLLRGQFSVRGSVSFHFVPRIRQEQPGAANNCPAGTDRPRKEKRSWPAGLQEASS